MVRLFKALPAVIVVLLIGALYSFFPTQLLAQSTNDFAALKEDLAYIQSQATAVLLFTPFQTDNPSFQKHILSDAQIAELCGGAGSCGNLGVNFGTHFKSFGQYEKANAAGMKWLLEIARGPKAGNDFGAVASVVNENKDKTVIVRIGITGNSVGFADHKGGAGDYIQFLKDAAGAAGGTPFMAIAGPNEPDIEKWVAPECGAAPGTYSAESETFYECIGPVLANYMNAVCNADIPDSVALTTPAFNMTSYTFFGIVKAMDAAGANWKCIAESGGGKGGLAGNLYPAGKSMQAYWNDENTGAAIKFLKGKGLNNIYITETGPIISLANEDDVATDTDAAKEAANFYLHPIKGFSPEANVHEIRDDLVKQGYEAQCAAPRFYITLEPGGQDAMRKLLEKENKPEGVVLGGADAQIPHNSGGYIKSKLSVDFRDSLVPVFRDLKAPEQLKRSLEDYFGYKELDGDSFNATELKSAAINSLLTSAQRCTQGVASLRARKEMCDKLQNPDECALYTEKVPGSNFTTKELLTAYEAYHAGNFAGQPDSAACSYLTGSESRDTAEIRAALLATPLQISKSYRVAFLVTTIRLKYPSTQSMFNLFSHPKAGALNGPNKPKTAVVVTAFKVPDITTNKGTIPPLTASGNTPFNDPAILTRDTLIPSFIRDRLNQEGTDERQVLLDAARAAGNAAQNDSDAFEIFCVVNPSGGAVGLGSCTDPLTKALVDIINGQNRVDKDSMQCRKDLFLEANESLFDSGSLQPLDHPSRVFQPNLGAALFKSLFTDVDVHNPGSGFDPQYGDTGDDNWNLKSVFHVTPTMEAAGFPYNPDEDDREVKHFLVSPIGYDQETIEMVLAGSFFSTAQLEELKKEAEERLLLQMKNAQAEFEGGEASYSFTDYTDCDEKTDPVTGAVTKTCSKKSFSFRLSLKTIPEDVGILGARLGYWMYTVQKALFTTASLPRKYLDACETVEQFLLDRCGGTAIAETFNETNYCENSNFATRRGVTNSNLENFSFYEGSPDNSIAASVFFPTGSDKSCEFNADVRLIDGLTLILSDGTKVVGNNPGNGSGCGGVLDASEILEIKRWPGSGSAPAASDNAWNSAPTLQTKGSSAARISYNLKLKPGVYRVAVKRNQKNEICISNTTEVYEGSSRVDGSEAYVFDLSGSKCSQRSCVSMNVQPAMEGGEKDETDSDVAGCELGFEYDAFKYNSACGGGRAGDCEDEGGCGFWGEFIDKLNAGSEHPTGYTAYKATFGRSLSKGDPQERSCTHEFGNNSPIFTNTMKIGDCSAVESTPDPLDSISLFDKLVSFKITYWDGTEIDFPLPSRPLWNAITAASQKHGCDPWLVLATAQAMNRDYTNQSIPDAQGALGIFQITSSQWTRWTMTNEDSVKNFNADNKKHRSEYGACDYWQPTSFSTSGMDFSSPTNMREAVDVACRRVLWSGAQREAGNEASFIRKLTDKGDAPDYEKEKFLPGDTVRAAYIFKLWNVLLTQIDTKAKSQPSGYPYAQCTGTPPVANDPANMNYDIPTVLPFTGVATYYSEGVMNTTLATRESVLREIPPAFIDSCEFNIPGTDNLAIFAELNRRAQSNGQSKVVGCAAMLRYGDVPFRTTKKAEDIRLVWVRPPDGAPDSLPKAIGPIAIIDVANKAHRAEIHSKWDGRWVLDMDYNTFQRVFSWRRNWGGPQDGITVCNTKEEGENL